MSGCVNCVWDAYREEVEAWAAKMGRVKEERLANEGEELFKGVPVGIREFMATEKKLREKKREKEVGEEARKDS